MESTSVELTQSVSQMSTYSARPVAEDLLDTSRMTIEDLIESKVVISHNIVEYLI